MSNSLQYSLGAVALALALASAAQAEKGSLPEQASDKAAMVAAGKQGEGKRHKADEPKGTAGKALPDQAADKAKENAFGQQGRRERAIHAAEGEAKAEAERLGQAGAPHGANSKAVGPGSDRGASAAARAGERGGPPANLDSVRNAHAAGQGKPADSGKPAVPGSQGRSP